MTVEDAQRKIVLLRKISTDKPASRSALPSNGPFRSGVVGYLAPCRAVRRAWARWPVCYLYATSRALYRAAQR